MRTDCRMFPRPTPLLSEAAEGGRNTVSIANESDQVTKGHLVDALAVRGEEGRGTLR